MKKILLAMPLLILALAVNAFAQSKVDNRPEQFTFRSGQAVYVTAFRRANELIYGNSRRNSTRENIERHLYYDHDLGAEKQIRNRIEKWRYFKVVDKASQSDFVFLVHVDSNAMEGIVLPREAYLHFREKFSQDARIDFELLREEAYQRYLAGPFKLSTLGRMSDKLIERFREGVGKRD